MSIEYNWPPDIELADGLESGRIGVTQSDESDIGGQPNAIDWEGASFPLYSVRPIVFKSGTDHLEQWEAFYDDTQRLTKPFWLDSGEPSRTHRWVFCGPPTDGTRTTFPIPIKTPTDVTVYVGSGPHNATVQASSSYTIHSKANQLSVNEATGDSVSYESGADLQWTSYDVGASLSSVAGVSRVGLSSFFMESGGAATNGIKPGAFSPPINGIAITPGNEYTFGGYALNAGAEDMGVFIEWWNQVDPALESTSSDTGLTTSASQWTHLSLTATAAAAPAAYAFPYIKTDSASNDNDMWFDCLYFNPGDYDRWHHPSVNPGLVEFSTAPATGQRVFVTATGVRLPRVTTTKKRVLEWRGRAMHHFPTMSLEAREYPEVSW